MNKHDLRKKVKEELELGSMEAADAVIDGVVKVVLEAVCAGEEIMLGDLGKFSKGKRPARKCRNPQTGEEMTVPEKAVVKFKPSGKFKKKVNE